MPCFRPLHAFKGKSKDPQKTQIVFKRVDSWRGEELTLPCGRCIGCRLERARQWAVRCTHEASLYENNCFLTLTYNDQNLPPLGSLVKSDFQKFMKRVRKSYGPGIRYFACGEYGDTFARPHYHALLFNHDFGDKVLFSERGGNKIFTSDELSRLWRVGFSVIGEVTFESASYVARYVMKKVTGDKADDHYKGRVPEFTVMSRRPGIGARWFDEFKTDVYPRGRVVVRGHSARAPRFYDDLFGRQDPSGLALLKLRREKDAGKSVVCDVTSDGKEIFESNYTDRRLSVQEICKEAEIKTLRRPLEEI